MKIKKWFNYAGSKLVKACKWIAGISATASGVYGLIGQFYTIPYDSQISVAGACISAVAMFIVGKAVPVKKNDN